MGHHWKDWCTVRSRDPIEAQLILTMGKKASNIQMLQGVKLSKAGAVVVLRKCVEYRCAADYNNGILVFKITPPKELLSYTRGVVMVDRKLKRGQ